MQTANPDFFTFSERKIPHIIHYCWFGNRPLPGLAKRCMRSWERLLPGFELRRWDETNFDIDSISYARKAYDMGKYAFVSDCARMHALYEYGGIYLDTDVELIAPVGDLLNKGAFMASELTPTSASDINNIRVNPGLGFAVPPRHPLIGEILRKYETMKFDNPGGKANPETIVSVTTDILRAHGLANIPGIQHIAGIDIYPSNYFCPVSIVDGKKRITPSTRAIHHFQQSWQSPFRKYGRRLLLRLGGVRLKLFFKRLLLR